MADSNHWKFISELLKKPGNETCADCNAKDPEWASYNLGIFLCTTCAAIHRGMGDHISKVKHLKLDQWENSQLERIKEVGNIAAKFKYEKRVPICYRKPAKGDPKALLEDWICAKYLREEFSRLDRQSFVSGNMEGFLMKRGKEDPRYHPRKFILSEMDNTLKYYIKENKDPKTAIKLTDLNVSFAPEKINMSNSLQLTYLKDNVFRHLFVYHDDPQTIVTWYTAIRCAKLHVLQIAFPSANENDLLGQLTKDFAREGWLWKTGPKPTDSYRKRWFTLDRRVLMYHVDPMDAHPKGEIFLGNMLEGYSVRVGVPPGTRDQGFSFTLRTPQRWYYLSTGTSTDRDLWIQAIDAVIDQEMTSQDHILAAKLTKKKNPGTIFSMRQ